MVFQRFPVDGEPLIFLACAALHLFVEAAFGLIAKPFVLQHLLEELGQLQIAALVVHVRGHVADDVSKDVQPNQIDGAECRRLRPSNGLSGQRVHLFDSQAHFLHQPNDIQHRECPNTIADEVRRVLGDDDAFTQAHVAEMRDGIDCCPVRLWCGNDLQQPHVSWRIEEVRPKPGPPEVV